MLGLAPGRQNLKQLAAMKEFFPIVSNVFTCFTLKFAHGKIQKLKKNYIYIFSVILLGAFVLFI